MRQSRRNAIVSFAIVDMTIYPDDTSEYLRSEQEWYRQEMLASFYLVTFSVSVRQSEKEARIRANEYLDFMNRQDDAIQIAIKLVTI